MSVDVTNATKSDQNRPSRDSVHQGPDAQTLAFAAALLIEDTHTDEEIARALGVARRTLARWKRRPDVALAMEVHGLLQLRELCRDRPYLWRDEVQGPLP